MPVSTQTTTTISTGQIRLSESIGDTVYVHFEISTRNGNQLFLRVHDGKNNEMIAFQGTFSTVVNLAIRLGAMCYYPDDALAIVKAVVDQFPNLPVISQ